MGVRYDSGGAAGAPVERVRRLVVREAPLKGCTRVELPPEACIRAEPEACT